MLDVKSFFQDRRLAIATKHEKEKIIAPVLEDRLGVICFVPEHLDTDILGTFTGEIERKDDPVQTLRNKCLMAMEMANVDLAIASEGSFGPHPGLFFVNADDELVMLLDTKNDFEIIARELSVDTNFNGSEIDSEEALISFANAASFPSHALIIRNAKEDSKSLVKGIDNLENLLKGYKEMNAVYGSVYVETDMRAMYNPSRQKVIEKATQKLVEKIFSVCPVCFTPGFDVKEIKSGLPCNYCGTPTNSTLSHVYECGKCRHMDEKRFPNQKTKEDPMYCPNCNP